MMLEICEAILIILSCIFIYKKFVWKPKVKIVNEPVIPDPGKIKKQRKRERKLRKIKRHFRLPYHGNAEIVEFDMQKPYIDSAWNEVQKPKK